MILMMIVNMFMVVLIVIRDEHGDCGEDFKDGYDNDQR